MWTLVLEKIKSRLASWNSLHLSLGGTITLLKSVLFALPIYYISFFKMPVGIINEMESLFKRFLWGGSEEARKINWVAWAKICKDKEKGGLGIKNLKTFNTALLGKWLWRVKTESQSLWARILREKYGVLGGAESCDVRFQSSWWRDLKTWKREGMVFWKIGSLELLRRGWETG